MYQQHKCQYSYCLLVLEFQLSKFFPVSILNRETNAAKNYDHSYLKKLLQ